jgi:plastocyanin
MSDRPVLLFPAFQEPDRTLLRCGPVEERRILVVVVHTRRASAWAAVVLAAGLMLAACSSSGPSASSAAATPPALISPGTGQSTLAGIPGSTATGPVTAGSGSAMPGMAMSSGAAASSNAVAVTGNRVDIKNFAFAPAMLTVKVGTKVTWTNQDSDAHTVTSKNNSAPLSSPALNTGQSYSYTFTKPGSYSYLCTIHPFMTATVVVTP